MTRNHRFVASCLFLLPASAAAAAAAAACFVASGAPPRSFPRACASGRSRALPSSPTPQHARANLGGKRPGGGDDDDDDDLFKTLELKDEALMQMITAVSSLEKAQESAVTNLENMQQQLQLQLLQTEQELLATKDELSRTRSELERTQSELQNTQAELALAQRESAERADELAAYALREREEEDERVPPPPDSDNPWQLFPGGPRATPVLNDWIAIKVGGPGRRPVRAGCRGAPLNPLPCRSLSSRAHARRGRPRRAPTRENSKYPVTRDPRTSTLVLACSWPHVSRRDLRRQGDEPPGDTRRGCHRHEPPHGSRQGVGEEPRDDALGVQVPAGDADDDAPVGRAIRDDHVAEAAGASAAFDPSPRERAPSRPDGTYPRQRVSPELPHPCISRPRDPFAPDAPR